MAKILIVDDSWVARLGMTKLLQSMGHQIIEAADGVQAISAIESEQPELVFLDLLMPDLDGYGVLEALQRGSSRVPTYVLSADIQETTLKKCLSLGARGCLAKPPSREAVVGCLKDLS